MTLKNKTVVSTGIILVGNTVDILIIYAVSCSIYIDTTLFIVRKAVMFLNNYTKNKYYIYIYIAKINIKKFKKYIYIYIA